MPESARASLDPLEDRPSLPSLPPDTSPPEIPAAKRPFWRLGLRVAGTGLLILFLWKIFNLDFGLVAAEMARANPLLVLLSVILVVPFIAVKAWRWRSILADVGIKAGFGRAYRLYALGLAAGSFTPGQAGDFIKAWQLKRDGHRLGPALISIVLDRLFDIAVLVMLAASGLLVLGADFVSVLPALLVLLLGTLAGLVALSIPAVRTKLIAMALRRSLRRPPGPSTGGDLARDETDAARQLQPVNLLPVFGLTLLGSALALVRIWLLALALGINLGLMEVVAASSLASVVSLLPVSVGGIGARDLALAGILGKLGYANEKAVGLASFILLLQAVNLAAGYLIWAARPQTEKDLAAGNS